MRKIFIPENRKELRGLVGKLVGLYGYENTLSVGLRLLQENGFWEEIK